ncbi:MAG: AraC family transcriptional regulator [Tenacibaculum sp.]|nr:AraC family transcriptional regulator [Tenacibaculum sp.]
MDKKLTFLFLLIIQSIFTQNAVIDSLTNENYENLKVSFQKIKIDSITEFNHAQAYLRKAKKEKNFVRIADGYYFLSRFYKDSLSLKYVDSIISISKKLKNHPKYPAIAYETKGLVFHQKGDFDNAIKFYVLALKHTQNNSFRHASVKFDIASLKYRLGFREEAKQLFKSYLNELDKLDYPNKDYYYNIGIYAYCDALIYTKKLDSAQIMIDEGIKRTLNSSEVVLKSRFKLNNGINSYYKKEYNKALKALKESLPSIKTQGDDLTTAINQSYIGKTYFELEQKDSAIIYLNKAHLFLKETNDVALEILDGYQYLINHYKTEKKYDKQLLYINALMKFDSVYNSKSRRVSQQITKSYEIPYLLSEKEKIISTLKENENNNNSLKIIFLIISIIAVLGVILLFRRNYILKKRFTLVVEQNSAQLASKKQDVEEILEKPSIKIEENSSENKIEITGVSEENIQKILSDLKKFEDKEQFLKKKYTLSSLAKELKTNSSYLSKVINFKKGTNFANYLNNLKIDYAINRLTSDKKFRSYTIKAISEESGFNSQQTFSIAFHKKTKLQPSYFIKQLEKQQNTE